MWYFIKFQLEYFSSQDLEEIRIRTKNDYTKEKIYNLIMDIKRDLLHKELEEKANPEINFDIQRIRKEMNYFDFPKELSELLSEIESLYASAITEKDFCDVADRIRKLLDQLIVCVSDRTKELKRKKITTGLIWMSYNG